MFPIAFLHIWTVSLYFSQVTGLCFYLLCVSCLCLSFVRSPLLIHAHPWNFCPNSCSLGWTTVEHREGEYQPAFWHPSSLQSLIPQDSSKRSLKRPKSALLKAKVVVLLSVLTPPLKILNITISWSLQPRLSSIFTFTTSHRITEHLKLEETQ